jgi:hypothetical protein
MQAFPVPDSRGLDPAIHAASLPRLHGSLFSWMAGSSPAMMKNPKIDGADDLQQLTAIRAKLPSGVVLFALGGSRSASVTRCRSSRSKVLLCTVIDASKYRR